MIEDMKDFFIENARQVVINMKRCLASYTNKPKLKHFSIKLRFIICSVGEGMKKQENMIDRNYHL